MASFGENLRREREMRGVTLQEISGATKISVRFLQAVEAEDFGQLPGGIFTRSFIRTYAKYLGLDEERVLAEYQLIAQPKSDLDLSRMTASRAEVRREGSRGPFLAILLAVVLVSGGFVLYRYSRRASELATGVMPHPAPTAPATTPSAPPPERVAPSAPGSELSATDRTSTGQETGGAGAAAAESTAANLPAPEEGLILQVAATERAWVAVDADGKTALQRVLAPSEIQTLKARESFDVTTGNAQGIVLTLNGETLKPLGRRGEVKSIHLTHSDLKKTSP